MPLSKSITTNNLKPYRQIGPLTTEQQAFVGAMRRIREGDLSTEEDIKHEFPELSPTGWQTLTELLHSQAAGRDAQAFWATYHKLARQFTPLETWRKLVATPSLPDADIAQSSPYGLFDRKPPADAQSHLATAMPHSDVQIDPSAGTLSADVQEQEAVSWLWRDRLPLGAITLLDAEQSKDRSLLMVDLAARVSSGKAMPDGTRGCDGGAGVIVIAPYQPSSDVMKARLQQAGTDINRILDLSRVPIPDPTTGGTQERFFSLAEDLSSLERAIDCFQTKLVIINPLDVTFGGYDVENDAHVLQLFTPLIDLVHRKQVACLLMRDMGYLAHKDLPRRGYGALTMLTFAESALKVDRYPHSNDNIRLTHCKNAHGEAAPTLKFGLESQVLFSTHKQKTVRNDVHKGESCQFYSPCDPTLSLRWYNTNGK